MVKVETVGKTYTTRTSPLVAWNDSISSRIDNNLRNTTDKCSILQVLKRMRTTIWVCSKTSTEMTAVVSIETSITEIQILIAG